MTSLIDFMRFKNLILQQLAINYSLQPNPSLMMMILENKIKRNLTGSTLFNEQSLHKSAEIIPRSYFIQEPQKIYGRWMTEHNESELALLPSHCLCLQLSIASHWVSLSAETEDSG